MFSDFVRSLQPGEEQAVHTLLTASFETASEAHLVEELRVANAMAGEMVLPMGETIIGYYALSAMRAPQGWLVLAPVAIHPDFQRRGHGRRMLGQLTAWAKAAGQWIVVLGEPAFYTRCGFDSGRASQLSSPYPITHTLLAGPGEDVPKEVLSYPKAFGAH